MDNCTRCIWSGKCSTEGSGLNCNEFTARKDKGEAMTHTPDCTCVVGVSLPDGVEPDDLPPVSYSVVHCRMHQAAPELLEVCKDALPFIGEEPTCDCMRCETGRRMKDIIANAALIAAAPELLEACKAVLPHVGAIQDRAASWIGSEYDKLPDDEKFSLKEAGFFDLIDQANELREIVKTAIAKAEGGAE